MRAYCVFDRYDLEKSWSTLNRNMEEGRIACKVLGKYGFDNSNSLLQNIYGHWFSFSLDYALDKDTHTNYWYFHLWDYTGNHALYSVKVKCDMYNVPAKESVEKIIEIMDMYSRDEVHCGDCNKIIKKSDIAGNYFAGHYCSICWETKWKAVEARETYE